MIGLRKQIQAETGLDAIITDKAHLISQTLAHTRR